MTAPTTLPDALEQIEELRGQVRDLLRLLGQPPAPSAAGVEGSPAKTTEAHEFSEGLIPKLEGKEAAQHLLDLHQMIETVPDIIFKLDLQGNLVGWNKRLETVTGFAPQELNGRPALAFVPEHEHAKTAAAIRQAFEEGYAELEGHLLTNEQHSIPYHWTGAAIKDRAGRIIGITGVGRDVSDKRRTQAELQRQRQQLLSAQALAHVGSWEWEIGSGGMEWSEEQFRILGHEPGTIPTTYEAFLAAVLPDDHDRVRTEITKALNGQETLDFECRIVRPNGEIRNIHCRGEIVPAHAGLHARMSGSTLDITDRTQSESALQQSEAHFRALIENSSDIITVLDLDGTIRFESPSFERLLGYAQHEIDGRIAFDFIHPDDLPTVLEKFQLIVQRPGESHTAEFRFRHKDGSWRSFEGAGRATSDSCGRPCVIANSRDITERKRAERSQLQTHDLLTCFVEHVPAAVAMLDRELRYVAVSRRWLTDYRLGDESLVGRRHYDVFPEIQDMKEWQEIHQRCLSGSVERREEDRFVRADGSEDWLRWEVRPWHDITGEIGGIIMFTEVITERKRAEVLLRSSQEKLRQILHASNTGLWDWNTETNEASLSREWKHQLGYDEGELPDVFETWESRLHPEDRVSALAYVRHYLAQPEGKYQQEFRLRHKDGSYRWIEARASLVTEPDGRRVRLLGSHTDITRRKQAEENVAASEKRLQGILDTIFGFVALYTLDGRVVEMNRTPLEIGGVSKADVLNRYFWEGVWWAGLPDMQSRLQEWMGRAAQGEVVQGELVFRVSSGELAVAEAAFGPLRDATGAITNVVGFGVNITERKRVEAALQQSEAHFRALIENSSDIITVLDLDGTIRFESPSFERLLGYAQHEIDGRIAFDFMHPDDLPTVLDKFQLIVQRPGESHTAEFRFRHKDGSWRQFEGVGRATSDSDGRPCVIANSRDITERKRAEAALRESEERYRTLVDLSPNGVFVYCNGKKVYVNQSACMILGAASPEQLIEDSTAHFSHPDSYESIHASLAQILATGTPVRRVERKYRRLDGTEIVVEVDAGRITWNGEPAVQVIFADITERKRVEAALKRSEERLRLATEATGCGILEDDLIHRQLYFSPTLNRMLGVPEDTEMTIESFLRCIHPDDVGRVKAAIQAAHDPDGDGRYLAEHRVIWPNDEVRWLTGKAQTFFVDSEEGKRRAVRVHGVVMDITERKQVEFSLLESDKRFNFAVEATSDGIWDWDIRTGVVYFSPQWMRLLGYSTDEVTPSTEFFFAILHPDDRARTAQMLQDHLDDRIPVKQLELRLRQKSGDYRWYLDRGKVVARDQGGSPLRMVGTITDITERKRTEEALRKSEERYARATAIAKVGVWELDVVSGLYHGDINLKTLFGYGPDEISTDPYVWLGLVHPEDQAIALQAWDRVVSGLTDEYHYELRMIRKDGTTIWTDVRGHAQRDGQGHVMRLFGATADITERKVIQDTLVNKERELRTMLDALPIGVWFTNRQGHVLYGNPVGLQIWSGAVKVGLPDQHLGTHHWENIEATDLPHRWAIGSVLTTDHPVLNEMIEIETANGTRRTIRNSAVQVRNDTGAIQGAILLNEDISERVHTERALHHNHELLSAIMDAATDIIFVKDLQGRYIHMNEAGAQTLGMTVEDVIGWNDYALWPSDLAASCQTADRRVLATGETVTIEEATMLDGKPTVFLTTKSPYRDPEGRIIGVIGVARDITERKRREEALLNIVKGATSSIGASFFHSLTKHLAASVGADYAVIGEIIGDRADHIRTIAVYADGHIADNFEYGLPNTPCQNILAQHAVSYVSGVQTQFPQFRLLADLGVEGYVGTPLRDSNGRMFGIMAVLYRQPIPDNNLAESMLQILATRAASEMERQQADLALKASEARLRLSLLASDTGLWEWNTETNEVWLSREWKSQIGYEDAELPNLFESWESRLHPDDHDRAIACAMQYRDHPAGALRQEFRLRHKDGTYRWIAVHASLVTEPDGRRVRLLGSHTDITERKQAEEALRQSEARLNEAQRLSHLGSWELNLRTNHLTWSDEIYRIFEIEREGFGASYDAFVSLLHPDDRSAVDRAYTNSVRDRTPYEITHRLLMPDGRVKYVHERCETTYDGEGLPVASFGTVQDVTERVRLSQRETARSEQLQRLSELGLTLSGDPTEIFERIAHMIGDLFKVRVVCLSEIVGPELHFKAVYLNGAVVRDAGHCPLTVTPCATVQQDKDVCLFDRVMERFPEATFLRDHQAVAYCGFPSIDAQGQVVAVTCLLDDKPREFTAEEQALLRVFGQRIAVEIERGRLMVRQKQDSEELRRSHAFIRQIIDTDPNFIFAKDRAGCFTLVNKAVADAYGTTVDNLIGKTDADFNPNPHEVDFFRLRDLDVMDSLQEQFIPEEKITDAAGNVRWLQTVKRPILDETGQALMVLGASTDITERKRIEETLRRREHDLQQAVEERERISEDLHDGILQSIYAIGLGLEACKPLISDQPKKSAAKLKAEIQRTIDQLNHVLEEVRNFIAGLESHILDGQDFDVVLRTMVTALAASYSIPTRVTVEKAAVQHLSTEQAYHVMHVAREALSNSFRHSHARRITLSLKCLRRSVRLSVTDNGVGFSPSTVGDAGHGLSNMASRAKKIRGNFTLRSKPRAGTTVVLDLPMRCPDAVE